MQKSKLLVLTILTFVLLAYFNQNFHVDLRVEHSGNISINTADNNSWATIIHENRILNSKLKVINSSIYVVGYLEGYTTYITKYNSSGVKLWEYTWKRSDQTTPFDFIIDSDNYLYIAGRIYNPSNYSRGIFLLKINASGHLTWSKIINSSTYCNQILITLDLNNDLYISGHESYYDSGTVDSIFLLKFNDSGDILWNSDLDINETDPSIIEMHIDSGNNLILYVGTFFSSQYLIKYNSSGSTMWYKEWGEDDTSGRSKVISGDDIIITGFTYYQNNHTADVWIMKINSSGFTINKTKMGNYEDGWWFWEESLWYYDDFNNTYFLMGYYMDGPILFKINTNLKVAWN
ncbi:unnamed protein product, partial [marine sediment metagenome]